MPFWFPNIWGIIRIRNLLSIIFLIYLSAECESADPQCWGSFRSIGLTRLSLINNFASFAFFRLLCFSTFHRQFAVTDWPEKLLFLFLKFFSNTIKVFLTCSLSFQCHSSPFSLWNDAFPFSRSKNFLCCHFSYFPNISLRIEISQNVFLAFYKAFEDFSLSLWKTFFHFLEIPLFVSSFFLFWKQLIEK